MTTSPTPVHPLRDLDSTEKASGSSTTTATKASATAMLALNMSWQLLIVVIVPVLVGHYADEHFKLTPWCTVTGMVLSLLGMITVVKLTLKELNAYMKIDEKETK